MTDEFKCPYGQSGDTCVPIMEDYPCICRLEDMNAELLAALELAERALSNSPATYEHELPTVRAAIKKAKGEDHD